jgi:hypothetical protein
MRVRRPRPEFDLDRRPEFIQPDSRLVPKRETGDPRPAQVLHLPPPRPLNFATDTTEITPGMAFEFDELAREILEALRCNPAIRIRVCSYGLQPNTSPAGWEQSRARLESVVGALASRGVPSMLIEPSLHVEPEPEFQTHSRAHVFVRVEARRVPGAAE